MQTKASRSNKNEAKTVSSEASLTPRNTEKVHLKVKVNEDVAMNHDDLHNSYATIPGAGYETPGIETKRSV